MRRSIAAGFDITGSTATGIGAVTGFGLCMLPGILIEQFGQFSIPINAGRGLRVVGRRIGGRVTV